MNLKDRLNKIIEEKRKLDTKEKQAIIEQLKLMDENKPNGKTILLLAPHKRHGELHPSLINYFLNLNYNVHLVLLEEQHKMQSTIRCDFDNDKLKIFPVPKMPVNEEFFNKFLRYSHIFIDTLLTYEGYYFALSLEEKYKKRFKKNNIYSIIHNMGLLDNENLIDTRFIKENKAFVLRDNIKYNNKLLPFVSPIYFGKINPKPKNPTKTTFMVVGGGNKKNLRNFSLLFSAIDRLIDEKFVFEVVLIGLTKDRTQEYMSDKNFSYIRNLGEVQFGKLYQEIENSDYILFNIDSSCLDYKKYLIGGITGSYSLSLGFLKPAVVDLSIAKNYNLENKCITYKENDLFIALKKAINLSAAKYQLMQKEIKNLVNKLYSKSLENIEEIFENE